MTPKRGAAVNQRALSPTSNNANLHYTEPPTQKPSRPMTRVLLPVSYPNYCLLD